MKLSALNFSAMSRKRQWLAPTIVGVVVTILFLLAYMVKPQSIQRLSDLFFDQIQNQSPREYNPDTPVRIIDIDDESIRRIGQWPWPRNTVAKLNSRLGDAGAAVIAYDIIFSEADRTSPENMLQVLESNPNAKGKFPEILNLKSHDSILAESFKETRVVTGFFLLGNATADLPPPRQGFSLIGDSPAAHLESYQGALFAIPELYNAASGAGHVSFIPDGDGVVRTAPLVGRVGDRLFPSLSAEALRVVQDVPSFAIKSANASGEWDITKNKTPHMSMMRIGSFQVPTTSDGKIRVHYTTPQEARYIPAWKIMSSDPKDLDWMDKIAGHIVFIGTGAEGLKDLVTTPIKGGERPGVVVHAQIAEQIIQGDYISKPYWTHSVETVSILIFGGILALLLPHLKAARGIILILVMGNAIYFSSYFAFTKYAYLLDPVYPLLSIIVSYILITLTAFYMTESERSRIRGAFSLYLSPEMVKQVSENPELLTLGGEEREISILFLDVRAFSKISETMRPNEITEFLNRFLTPMTNILQSHEATIDKYIGDAIVAFWNAPLDDPLHQRNAARAVLEMQAKLADLNAKYRNQNEFRWPDTVRMGIGINTGVCCVGNLGSEQRFSYSMIGDAANLASRIEGLTKQYGLSNLIGYNTAKELNGFAVLEADIVSVVGRVQPETIFMLVGDEHVAREPDFKNLRDTHNEFLKAYRNSEWSRAKALCETLHDLSKTYKIFRYYDVMSERITSFSKTPPEGDWKGIYVAQNK